MCVCVCGTPKGNLPTFVMKPKPYVETNKKTAGMNHWRWDTIIIIKKKNLRAIRRCALRETLFIFEKNGRGYFHSVCRRIDTERTVEGKTHRTGMYQRGRSQLGQFRIRSSDARTPVL